MSVAHDIRMISSTVPGCDREDDGRGARFLSCIERPYQLEELCPSCRVMHFLRLAECEANGLG